MNVQQALTIALQKERLFDTGNFLSKERSRNIRISKFEIPGRLCCRITNKRFQFLL
jgi:hypothetical protein